MSVRVDPWLHAVKPRVRRDRVAGTHQRTKIGLPRQLQIVKPPLELPPYTIDQVWHPRIEADPPHMWLRRVIARVAHQLPDV